MLSVDLSRKWSLKPKAIFKLRALVLRILPFQMLTPPNQGLAPGLGLKVNVVLVSEYSLGWDTHYFQLTAGCFVLPNGRPASSQ